MSLEGSAGYSRCDGVADLGRTPVHRSARRGRRSPRPRPSAAASACPRWSSISAAERIAAVGSAFCWPAMSGAEPWTGSNMLGAVRSGLMLPLAARPMPPVIGGREVGDDVAEQVVGDDHVEARRVGGHEDRGGVDVQVVDRHVGELGADLGHQPRPHRAGVDQHVGLVHEGELLAGTTCGTPEGVTYDPLDAEGRVDADLGGDLGGVPTRSAPPLPV